MLRSYRSWLGIAANGDPNCAAPCIRTDVVAALNVVMPYDWDAFLRTRVEELGRPPLGWIERGGYRLSFVTTTPPYWRSIEHRAGVSDLRHSIGLPMGFGGAERQIAWNGQAFRAGLAPGATLLRISARPYSDAALLAAIRRRQPVTLTVRQMGVRRTLTIAWTNGLRYPTLVRASSAPAGLDSMLEPR